MKKLLIGGSPCTHWSIAQKKNRETTANGLGWELFKNFLIAKEKFKPDFFLYENNKSMASAIKEQITKELGVEPILINSALVSAQNRQRYYWTNIPNVEQPKDRGIFLRDVVKKDRVWFEILPWSLKKWGGKRKLDTLRTLDSDKSFCVTTNKSHPKNYYLNKSRTMMTKLDSEEVELMQTIPIGYTKSIVEGKRFCCIGNCWTAEVIIHILKHANIPLDEELQILSMYDGIATGRYCLDKMGYKNVTYTAYEIDKYAIQVAMSNYPDIIQKGDAFQVREEGWSI